MGGYFEQGRDAGPGLVGVAWNCCWLVMDLGIVKVRSWWRGEEWTVLSCVGRGYGTDLLSRPRARS
jgi:hypothetical protein